MSSLTISMIVCVDCQPCSSIVGLNTRTRGAARLAACAKFQCDSAAPYRSAGCALGEILGVDLPEVRAHEALERRAPLGRDAGLHQGHGLLDAVGGLVPCLGVHRPSLSVLDPGQG